MILLQAKNHEETCLNLAQMIVMQALLNWRWLLALNVLLLNPMEHHQILGPTVPSQEMNVSDLNCCLVMDAHHFSMKMRDHANKQQGILL